ncbi:hypothetical protein D6D27_10313 [Aureobasidium pullulans]|nr:hypothetical protein D6D27_10313 [Aureobasidium pullulans]
MQLVLLFCFVLAAHSLAIEQRSCVSPEVLTVSKQVSDPHYFCAWYLKEYGMSNFVNGRTNSPILGINVNALLSACQCVVSVEPSGTEAKNLAAIQKAARLQSFVSATCPSTPANPITKQFTSPTSFCQFFASFERHDSPIPNLNVPAVRKACKCILSGPKISTSSMVKSTSKPSSSIKGSTSSVAVNYGQKIFYCDQIFNKDLIIEDHRLKQELIINQTFCDFIVINFANLKTRVILKQVFVIQIFD